MGARSRPRKAAIVVIAVVGVVLVVSCGGGALILSRYIDVLPQSNHLPEAVERYRAAGMPWTAAELMGPHKPDDLNAAPLLQDASRSANWKAFSSEYRKLREKAAEGDAKGVLKDLAPYDQALKLTEKASHRPYADFGRDWDLGTNLVFSELDPSKRMAQALAVRAVAEAKEGDAAGSARDLLACRRIGALVAQEPTEGCVLAQVSIDAVACRAFQECAAIFAEEGPRLKSIAASLFAPVPPPSFGHALKGEAFFEIAALRNPDMYAQMASQKGARDDETSPSIDARLLKRDGMPQSTLARSSMAVALDMWAKEAPVLAADDPLAIARELDSRAREFEDKPTASNMMLMIMLPVFSQAGQAVVKDKADTLATKAIVQALIVRNRTGHLPSRIEEIPGTWTDPYSNRALLLTNSGGHFRIYSVGPDRVDNGGKARSELPEGSNTSTGYDIVAAFPPLPLSRTTQ